jgi:hypothetical protein
MAAIGLSISLLIIYLTTRISTFLLVASAVAALALPISAYAGR